MKKVSDEQLMEFLWDCTLKNVSARTLIHYIGDQVGTYSLTKVPLNVGFFTMFAGWSVAKKAPLSKSQFRVRINKLTEKGEIKRLFHSYQVLSPYLTDMCICAVRFYQRQGLPFERDVALPVEKFNLPELRQKCYEHLKNIYINPDYVRVREEEIM